MLDKNDLQAIADLMDLKLKPVYSRLDQVNNKMEALEDSLQHVSVVQENEVLPKLQLLYENQSQIIDEHKAMTNLERKVEVLEDEVFALKTAFKELKKA